MIKIGINGFGRIGKCVFLQLLEKPHIYKVCCINVTNIKVNEIEEYLRYDSVHRRHNTNFDFKILSETEFIINDNIIRLIGNINGSTCAHWKHDISSILIGFAPFMKDIILKKVGLILDENLATSKLI